MDGSAPRYSSEASGATQPQRACDLRSHDGICRLTDSIVRVSDIAAFDLVYLEPASPAALECFRLRAIGLTAAPIKDPTCLRYTTVSDLERTAGTVEQAARPIPVDMIISSSASLSLLIERLEHAEFYFVYHDTGISAIVTRSDLQQPIVGMAVLGYIVGLEQALGVLIVDRLGPQWPDKLGAGARQTVESIYLERKRHGLELGLLDCLSLSHRLNLAGRDPGLLSDLGFKTKNAYEATFVTPTIKMRNMIAHGSGLLASAADPVIPIRHYSILRSVVRRAAELADAAVSRSGRRSNLQYTGSVITGLDRADE